MTTTTTLNSPVSRRAPAEPFGHALNKATAGLLAALRALDRKLSERPASRREQAAELLRLADAYEHSQPSYAADLRAAALADSRGEIGHAG